MTTPVPAPPPEDQPQPQPIRSNKRRRLSPPTTAPSASTSAATSSQAAVAGAGSGSGSTTAARRRIDRRRSSTPEPPPRNFDEVRFGDHVIDVEFFSPYPDEVGRDAADANGQAASTSTSTSTSRPAQPAVVHPAAPPRKRRLWVCDKCFAYTRVHERWRYHAGTCQLGFPPGRKVYVREQVTIWEVDSSDPAAKAFCANLSLFGKLFIDHKTIFYDVTDFLFYVVAEAWPNRDVIYGYFSKEKHDVNDHNVACIMVFPPFQSGGWGRLLMEFSYWLTRDAASPGTPEQPLSAAGKRGYEAYWCKVVLRAAINMLVEGPSPGPGPGPEAASAGQAEVYAWMRERLDRKRKYPYPVIEAADFQNPPDELASLPPRRLTLAALARRAHVKLEDARTALSLMGFLAHTTPLPPSAQGDGPPTSLAADGAGKPDKWAELCDREVVMPLDVVLKACEIYGVRTQGVLDVRFCLEA